MSALYVISLQPYSGKTAVCLGIGLELKAQGVSVGYMKPIGTLATEVGGQVTDEDVVFVLRTLDIDEPFNLACPLLKTTGLFEAQVPGATSNADIVRAAFDRLAKDVDLMILEGGADLADGYSLGVPQTLLAELTQSRVIVVVKYQPDLAMDEILMAKDAFGERMVGVIVNSVPQDALSVVKERFPSFLNRSGLQLIGVLPLDRLLTAIPVRELARLLNGDILCAADKQDELVENFSIGAMNVDTALKYFLRSANKAVITGGDRADIQLAALQTSTKCIILTGNLYPDAIILGRATELGVPMILVKADTMTTVASVERALGHIRLTSPRQINRLVEMVKADVNICDLRRILEL
ncbi:MAG: phosphotransacetylase family protein [Chloroflexi bacterium]|nr:phosphotransacetylase family protein [Chloroflexota bacterium]